MRKQAFLCLVLGAWAGGAAAETVYVTDSLRLGLHAAADTSDKPFDNLISGTPVEVLERNSSFAHVRLADGREGWVKATFLVADKPAAARVLELEAERGKFENAAAAAKTSQAAAEQQLTDLRRELQATTGSSESIKETIERLERENTAYIERLEAYRHTLPLVWVLPTVVVALVAGFLLGLWWLDALIRRRHGGFRVY
ncbi:MAG TPA: TIGR04211 family SH3 domain-containing protein [Gammaproteobacteria bacterium]|nr:TIGR04211 family SH3 domain-containing protein [Gammaproteobacteria bacterium]